MDVVINDCCGAFGLSNPAIFAYFDRKGITLLADAPDHFSSHSIPRHDPDLVAVVKAMGAASAGTMASLRVIEIPDGIDYAIWECDGIEHVYEVLPDGIADREELFRAWSL